MEPNPAQPTNQAAPRFLVKGQYIKDLSFENPHAPASLLNLKEKPGLEVSVDLKAQKLQDGMFELTMLLSARASAENATVFLVELAYGGLFQLVNVPEEHIEPLLLVDAPFVLFPFARRVISDITRDGGFPPLMLEPIDFHALYRQNKSGVRAS
jgi:preprotein translocase subunit SecB